MHLCLGCCFKVHLEVCVCENAWMCISSFKLWRSVTLSDSCSERVSVCERDPAMTFDPKCLLKKAHVSIAEVPGLTLVLRCHGYCIYYWYLKHAVFGGRRGLCVSNHVLVWQVSLRGCYAGCYAVLLELQCRMSCDRGPSANSTQFFVFVPPRPETYTSCNSFLLLFSVSGQNVRESCWGS